MFDHPGGPNLFFYTDNTKESPFVFSPKLPKHKNLVFFLDVYFWTFRQQKTSELKVNSGSKQMSDSIGWIAGAMFHRELSVVRDFGTDGRLS